MQNDNSCGSDLQMKKWKEMEAQGLGVIVFSSSGKPPRFILGYTLKGPTVSN